MADDKKNDKLDAFTRRLSTAKKGDTATFMAATVVLLRDTAEGMEALMLRKNSKIAFGGMWVFPGGRIDDDDGGADDEIETRARIAAVREAQEECALELDPESMSWISHWTPPAIGNRRFITWFYMAPAPDGKVVIDDGEIIESLWLQPTQALEKQAAGEIELAPPTHITLHYLSAFNTVEAARVGMVTAGPRYYATHIGQLEGDLVAMWQGDAGYDDHDASIEGLRHRLRMKTGGWEFEDSGAAA